MLPPIVPILLLAWMAFLLLSCAGVVVHAFRHGSRRIVWSLLCPVGALLWLAFFSAGVGIAERTWTLASLGFWMAVMIGGVGVLLSFLGWREVLRKPRRTGDCTGCGYPVTGLKVCPECGRPS